MWNKSEYDTKPSLIDESISEKYVYIRRNVEAIGRSVDTNYRCEEMKVPKDIYPIIKEMNDKIEGLTYTLNQVSNTVMEVVKKDDSDMPVGDYLNPITYHVGDKVVSGNFYTDGEDIWEAWNTGVPVDFTDKNFFDIIA